MATPKKNNIPPEKLDWYEKLIATNPHITRKGAANPYTSLNGHMFSYLNPEGTLALRLAQAERGKYSSRNIKPRFLRLMAR
jgi:hypothetical protein